MLSVLLVLISINFMLHVIKILSFPVDGLALWPHWGGGGGWGLGLGLSGKGGVGCGGGSGEGANS